MLSNYKRILDLSPSEFESFRQDLARAFGLERSNIASFKAHSLFGQWTREDIHDAFERLDELSGGKLLFSSLNGSYCVGSHVGADMPLISNPCQLPCSKDLLSYFIK